MNQETELNGSEDSEKDSNPSWTLSRRALVVGGIGAVGVVAAACSSSASAPATSSAATTPAPSTPSGSGNAPTGVVLTQVSDIPVGGAKIATGGGTTWLLAQPTAGNVVCHSGICTHEGCPLSEVERDEGICTCHGSRFNANDGAVVQGPATEPLAAQSVKINGKNVELG